MQVFLSWNLARNVVFKDRRLHDAIKETLLQSLRISIQTLEFAKEKGVKIRYVALAVVYVQYIVLVVKLSLLFIVQIPRPEAERACALLRLLRGGGLQRAVRA